MKTLGVKFSDKTDSQLKEIAKLLDMPQSKVARAALNIGLDKIKICQDKDSGDTKKMIAMQDAFSKY